ncbi:DUF1543 domain-containing protein [Chitinophaga sancti]|uniref:DUF1543 domain-containing protein n=2 Tax=Chitinophaga sancti TaxID=1004 RepID=A0ABZ0XLI3_9BACT|nr:DUF1543 domain-containing protein [Chitinophaga sancti]WQD63220.1 DUF1543 domain-containing protein [Chitinophaga sancti]WQG91154.1 DUF1543 domain-containing protein [Chitinophaga sancti]
MEQLKLFMILAGCKPAGRHTEQHDVFFGIASSLQEVIPALEAFWPEAKGNLHLDAFREVTLVDEMQVKVIPRAEKIAGGTQLYFINLGGYKENEMEEFHYKLLSTGKEKNEALKKAKATAFFKHTSFPGATSHIDDKYGVDIDDFALIEDILPENIRAQYALQISSAAPNAKPDQLHLGYFRLDRILKGQYASE